MEVLIGLQQVLYNIYIIIYMVYYGLFMFCLESMYYFSETRLEVDGMTSVPVFFEHLASSYHT